MDKEESDRHTKKSNEHFANKVAEIKKVTIIFRVSWVCPKCYKISLKDTLRDMAANKEHARCGHCCQYVQFGKGAVETTG